MEEVRYKGDIVTPLDDRLESISFVTISIFERHLTVVETTRFSKKSFCLLQRSASSLFRQSFIKNAPFTNDK